MIKVGIIGATGYAGNELVRLLLGHKDAEIVWYGSRSYIDQKYADVYRNMFQLVDAVCMDDNMDELAKQVDVIFTATPQGLCASLVNEEILSNTKIVDLSADFRLKDVSIYEQWYKLEHKAPQYIDEAVYGLCEINRNQITEKTRIVANPGCYTTTSILTLYPMVKEGLIDPDTIIIDAKSGTSGAGRGAKVANLFCEVNESMKAYGVGTHLSLIHILFEMADLKVPVLSIVIGEGGSGGALALAAGNEVWMLENSVYSILSPEGFASILWKDASKAEKAAQVMKLTAQDLKELGIIEQILPEFPVVSSDNMNRVTLYMKRKIAGFLIKYQQMSGEELAQQRYQRFRGM